MKYSYHEFTDKLYKRITLGKAINSITLQDLKKGNYEGLIKPVFILSTGRCRTHWLTNILSEIKSVYIEHNPAINFLEESKLLYAYLSKANSFEPFFSQLFQTARDNIFLECAKRNLRYIETNNRITIAAPVIKELIPHSKFVHLTRHPIKFIQSGRNRNWYNGDGHDLGRITYSDHDVWSELTANQKIGWLWVETNKFILEQVSILSEDRYYYSASENLDRNSLRSLIDFMELDSNKISNKWLNKPTNKQINKMKINEKEILTELMDSFFHDDFKALCDRFEYKL